MTFVPIHDGNQVRILVAHHGDERDVTPLLLGTGYNVRMRLSGRVASYAARIMMKALDKEDYEVVAIIEYALFGAPRSSSFTMAELAGSVISLQKFARKKRDKKMLLVLKAAAANAAG